MYGCMYYFHSKMLLNMWSKLMQVGGNREVQKRAPPPLSNKKTPTHQNQALIDVPSCTATTQLCKAFGFLCAMHSLSTSELQ